MEGSTDLRIVLLGKTGCGKSSLANTILGEEVFSTSFGFRSETKQCESTSRWANGRLVTVVDTPGFLNTDLSDQELKREMVRCIAECAPGPHVVLIVIKVEKFTEHEQAVASKILRSFSDEALQHAVVAFTHGDQFGGRIEEFVDEDEVLRDLVGKCGGRCHVVDNKYWNRESGDEYRSNKVQVGELFETIERMMKGGVGRCYTNEILKTVEEEIQGEVSRQAKGKKPEAGIRRQARRNVFENLQHKLADFEMDELLNAFLGGSALQPVTRALQSKPTRLVERLVGWLPWVSDGHACA